VKRVEGPSRAGSALPARTFALQPQETINPMTASPNAPPSSSPRFVFDWTMNVTTVLALVVMLAGWVANYAVMSTRMTALESQGTLTAIAMEKQSNTIRGVADTLIRLDAQVAERQRIVDMRQDRSDFRQDKAELRNTK
jgi:hypothetical protein